MKRKSKATKAYKEFMMRLFTLMLSLMAVGFMGVAIYIMTIVDSSIREIEASNIITCQHVYIERMSVEEQFAMYIDSLPVPEEKNSEWLEKEPKVTVMVKKQEEISPVKKANYIESAYDLSDKELLAQLMYAEEGIFFKQYEENPEQVELVHKLAGSVALHRFKSHYMGAQSLSDVLYAKNQYDVQTVQRVEQGQDMPDIVYVWAEDLLQNGPIGPETLIYQSEFKQGSDIYEHIGNQYFCLK